MLVESAKKDFNSKSSSAFWTKRIVSIYALCQSTVWSNLIFGFNSICFCLVFCGFCCFCRCFRFQCRLLCLFFLYDKGQRSQVLSILYLFFRLKAFEDPDIQQTAEICDAGTPRRNRNGRAWIVTSNKATGIRWMITIRTLLGRFIKLIRKLRSGRYFLQCCQIWTKPGKYKGRSAAGGRIR